MPETRTRVRDQPITAALLIGGVISVTRVVAFARDLPVSLDESYGEMGGGRFTATAVASGIGYAICAVQVLALVVAIAVSVPRMREGRSSFWVPLVAAVVAFALTFVLVAVAITTDLPTLPGLTASPTGSP